MPRLLAACVCAGLFATASLAQQAPPTFRSSANLIRLHVIVQDDHDRPVRGLTRDDFAVLDAKKPRGIDIFEEVARSTDPRAEPIFPATFPLDVADNRAARVSQLIVIVFDDMVVRPYLEKSKALARDVVHRFGEGSLFAVFMTSGMDGVEATADRSAILRAIDRAGTPASAAPGIPRRIGDFTSHVTLAEQSSSGVDKKGCHLTLLENAARMIAGPEALRRAFVYITPFCGYDIFDDDTPGDPYAARRTLIEALRRSDVALYALDPRGELGFGLDQFPTFDIIGESPTVDPVRFRTKSASPVLNSQEGLRELAKATGGIAVTNSSEYEKGLKQLSDDLSHYYVLGFHADDPKPNRYHPVDVSVNRPGLTVRSRPGYVSGNPAPARVDKDPMVRLSAGAVPADDLPLRLFAASEPRGARSTRVSLVLEVGWTGLERPDNEGTWREALDATMLVARVVSGKIERKWALKRTVTIPVKTAPEPGRAAYQVMTHVDLPPGSYQIRASVKSGTTGKAGSVYRAVDVQDPGVPLFLGEILVAAIDRANPIVGPSPAGVAPLPLPITLERGFSREERIRLFASISQGRNAASLKATAEIVDVAGTVVRAMDAAMTSGDRAIDTTLELKRLAAGPYRVRLTVTAGSLVASRDVSFRVF